ncbi:MAG: ATP-dependent nuclease subunit B-like protein [Ilumatobacteraceae bacterium]|nr:ATP-dependent nuclease subunit B-like protein [Ilumatobacteraceae bacterium]
MGEISEIAADGPPALQALRVAIDHAQAGSPLSPVTVIVPSNSVGVAARRWLAANGGIAAAQFVTTYRLAELLGAPSLIAAGRRPVNTPVVDVAVRRALHEAAGMFAPVAHHHATITALRDVHRELRHVPGAALDRLGRAGSPRAREVVRLHRHVTAQLAGTWYDEADLLQAALAPTALRPQRIVQFLPERRRHTEQRLLDALSREGSVHTIVARGELRARGAVEVLDVSDADDEATEAVRQIVAATQAGVPLERIAAVWPVANPYARLLTEHLDAAGIPWNGRPGVTLHERLAARLLLDVLAIDRRGIRRVDLFNVLAHVPARDAEQRLVPAQRWERLSRDAGLATDADWGVRLADYQRAMAADPERERNATDAAALGAFVAELRALLGPPDQTAPWLHWADLCHGLLTRWLGGHRRIARLPADELEAYGQVQAAVDRLGRLDELDGHVTRSVFLDALGAELDTSPGRVGRIGSGVQVGPLSYALGQSLDLVLVLGASDGQLPSPPTTDPLLGDADRALTDGALVRSEQRLADQRDQFVGALAAAARAVVLVPRGDMRATSVRQPSRWLGELATVAPIGRRSVPSFAAGLADASFPATATHHRIRALTHHVRTGAPLDTHPLTASIPALRAGLATVRAREASRLTEYDGDLAGIGVASPLADGSAVSPTRLESWAACPYAYFVQYVLGVRPIDEPNAQLRIKPMDQGTLVHEALDRFHRQVLDGQLPQPGRIGWTDAHLTALLAAFEDAAAELAGQGRVGRVAPWQAGRVGLRNHLRHWLAADSQRVVARGATVVHSEYAFGPGPRQPDAGPAASIKLPSGRVAKLLGKIDRIDRGADGTWYVVDHKTGSMRSYKDVSSDDPTAAGRRLQLPAYAAATLQLEHAGDDAADPARPADALASGEEIVHAEYSFVTNDDQRVRGATFTPQTWAAVGATLERIVDGIESGLFFAIPDGSLFRFDWTPCEFCDPDHLGTTDRFAELLRKTADPRVRAFLGGPDAAGSDDPSGNGGGDG